MSVTIILGYIIVILASLFILFTAFHQLIFLRNPKREIPTGRVIVSPADGKVIDIIRITKKEIKIKKGLLGQIKTLAKGMGNEAILVSIFMNPISVHYNRAPIEGKVTSSKHKSGKFLPTNTIERGLQNEKHEILIENKDLGKIKVIQIAGFLARRIDCFVKKGDMLEKGERFGLINLGSQASVILPTKVQIKIKKGDRVKAGSSIIAEY